MEPYVDPDTELTAKKRIDAYIEAMKKNPNLDAEGTGAEVEYTGYYVPPKLTKSKKPKVLLFKKTANGFEIRVTN